MSDWRRETAADVGWGNWEAQEAKSAERDTEYITCPPGHHRMVSDGCGGGICSYCGETINKGEI